MFKLIKYKEYENILCLPQLCSRLSTAQPGVSVWSSSWSGGWEEGRLKSGVTGIDCSAAGLGFGFGKSRRCECSHHVRLKSGWLKVLLSSNLHWEVTVSEDQLPPNPTWLNSTREKLSGCNFRKTGTIINCNRIGNQRQLRFVILPSL